MSLEISSFRIKEVVKITKFVKNHGPVLASFQQKQEQLFMEKLIKSRKALEIPCETRWYSCFLSISRVLCNKKVLIQTFEDPTLSNIYLKDENYIEI